MAGDVVELLNKSVANKIGWHIDLRRWEETPPSFGRPQDSINPLVDECDLFVGLLWRSWGQPPIGGYSSGFEEEFERAKARREATGFPEIWLMFKDVEKNEMRDPGDQLKKVIEFRESQIRLKEVKFTNVKNSADWKSKLQSWLSQYLLDFAHKHPEALPQQPVSAPSPNSAIKGAIQDASSSALARGLPAQLKAISATLGSAAANGALDLSARDSSLSEFEVVRLFLLSGTLISGRYTNLILGTHEINLLYKHRIGLDAATDERIEILRSIIGAGMDLNPGWFWFQDLDEQLMFDLLFKFAIDDNTDSVRIGALDLLTQSGFQVSQESWPLLPLAHESWGVRSSAFNYLAEVGDGSTLKFLDKIAANAEDALTAADARDARFRVLCRLAPDTALAETISNADFVSTEKAKLLDECTSKADERTLLRGTDSSLEQVRRLCVRELARRRCLPTEVAHKVVQDSSLPIRAIALASLAEDGNLPGPRLVRDALKGPDADSQTSFILLAGSMGGKSDEAAPEADSIVITFYSKQSPDATLAAVDWFSQDARLAYKALALNHFEFIEPNIVQDLATGFSRIKKQSLSRIEANSGPDAARQWESAFKDLDDFIASQFAEAALLGIAKHGLPGAADIAKPYLSQDTFGLRDAAVKVVCKFGDSEYVSDLLRISKETYGERQKEAASGALKLSSSPAETAADLLRSNSADLVDVAFSWMQRQNSHDFSEVFRDFLHDENGGLRLRSLAWLSKRLEKGDLENLLRAYVESGTYYYDVVTWLDRLLYATPRLRESFVQKLVKEAV